MCFHHLRGRCNVLHLLEAGTLFDLVYGENLLRVALGWRWGCVGGRSEPIDALGRCRRIGFPAKYRRLSFIHAIKRRLILHVDILFSVEFRSLSHYSHARRLMCLCQFSLTLCTVNSGSLGLDSVDRSLVRVFLGCDAFAGWHRLFNRAKAINCMTEVEVLAGTLDRVFGVLKLLARLRWCRLGVNLGQHLAGHSRACLVSDRRANGLVNVGLIPRVPNNLSRIGH